MKPNTVELGSYTLAQLPKGEYIRLTENGPVWIRGDYDRSSRKYELTRFDDVNRVAYRKGTTTVFAGFSF